MGNMDDNLYEGSAVHAAVWPPAYNWESKTPCRPLQGATQVPPTSTPP